MSASFIDLTEELKFAAKVGRLLLNGPFNDQMTEKVFYFLCQKLPKNTQIYIESEGGEVAVLRYVLDALNSDDRIKSIIACGECSSCAAALVSCFERERIMYEHATLMFHQVAYWGGGKQVVILNDLNNANSALQHDMNWMFSTISERTNVDIKSLRNRLASKQEEIYISASDALSLNLVDTVVSKGRVLTRSNKDSGKPKAKRPNRAKKDS